MIGCHKQHSGDKLVVAEHAESDPYTSAMEKMIATPSLGYLARMREAHERSGLSLREVARICDLDHSYVSRTLNGERKPHRDVIISLCVFAWRQSRIETDEILLLAGHPPLGRAALREYRRNGHQSSRLRDSGAAAGSGLGGALPQHAGGLCT